MFSIITTASSTTKQVAMVSAINERLFKLKPSAYMTAKVPMIDTGTAIDGMNVAAGLPRNRKITSTTRMTARVSSICTSWTEARIVVVRSVRTDTLTDEGRVDSSVGRSRFTRSTTWIRLAPRSRWMLTMTAGSVPIQAAWRTFSASSMVSATSERWTGPPLRYPEAQWRYFSLKTHW